MIHPTVMFRRSLLDAYGDYRDGDFPEDYELWLRWLEAGVRMAKLPETLLMWRERPDRLSRVQSRYAVDASFRCKTDYLVGWLLRKGFERRRIVVWGAGRKTRRRMSLLTQRGIEIFAFVDVDPRKIGKFYDGCPVLPIEDLLPKGDFLVLSYVANRGARTRIEDFLQTNGYLIGVDYLLLA